MPVALLAGMLVVVMGVSGSGKSSVGVGIAERLGLPYIEGDDFHPPENVAKMASGKPLDDNDRWPWLESLHQKLLAAATSGSGCVMVCSALKKSYRDLLRDGLPEPLHIVYLHGEPELLLERLGDRDGHFFPPALLDSQFEALEEPKSALRVSIEPSLEEVIENATNQLRTIPDL